MLYVVDWFYEPVHGIGYDQTNPCPVWDLIIVFWCILPTDDFPTQMVIVAMFDCDNLICHRCKANPCTYSSGPIDRRPYVKLFEDVDDISWFCNWAGLINQQYPIVQLQNQQGTIVVVNQSYRTIIAGSQFFSILHLACWTDTSEALDKDNEVLKSSLEVFRLRIAPEWGAWWRFMQDKINSVQNLLLMTIYYVITERYYTLWLYMLYIYILYYDYILCYIMCHYLLII